jgi:hypothetical protein
VDITGAAPSEVEIAIDPDRIAAHGLALNELAERLRAVNFSVSAGLIDDGGQRLRVQPVGELTDLQELRDRWSAPTASGFRAWARCASSRSAWTMRAAWTGCRRSGSTYSRSATPTWSRYPAPRWPRSRRSGANRSFRTCRST